MKVKLKRLHPGAVIPTKAHATDAGFDLTATSRHYDNHGCIVYGTGIAVEIPEGHVGLVFPRSSIAKYGLALTNAVGVIDSGYRGEIMAKFKPTLLMNPASAYPQPVRPKALVEYAVGDRVAQLIILPVPAVEFIEATDLSTTDRGIGGYGSTGN